MDKSHTDMLIFTLMMISMPTLGVLSYFLKMWWSNRQSKRPKPKEPTVEEIRVNAELVAAAAHAKSLERPDMTGLT